MNIDGLDKRYPTIGIIIIAAALVMGSTAVLELTTAYAQQEEGETVSATQEQIQAAVQAELEDEANDIPGTAVLFVYSNTEWTGKIIDSLPASTPLVGAGDDRFEFTCEGEFANFSASFQRQTTEGYLALAAIQGGNLIDTVFTDERPGIVTISESCVTEAAVTGGDGDSACLIATAAFGSEMAPQVQFLRDFRENHILSTAAGQSFMSTFNAAYYSFSPQVADYEREQPWLQHLVRIFIYPLLGILTVSEKAYSVSEGELGAVAAGMVASSLIGAVYLAPMAYSIKQVREWKNKPSYRILALVVAGVSAALAISIWAQDTMAMMVTTSALVLSVSAVSAIVVARAILILFKKKENEEQAD